MTIQTDSNMINLFGLSLAFLVLMNCTSFPQDLLEQLKKRELKYIEKIEIGSSTNEIKNLLGKPNSVQVGFPDVESNHIYSLPDFNGQLNYTSWIYKKNLITIKYTLTGYFINDKLVDEDIYNEYLGKTDVYTRGGKIIPQAMAESYLVLKDGALKKEPIISGDKSIYKKTTSRFIPMLYVIFERGTQVVVEAKVLFLTLF